MIWLAALALGLGFSQPAHARVLPACGQSFGEDSAALGVYDAVKGGQISRPAAFRQGCYDEGFQEGQGYITCNASTFDAGVADGKEFKNSSSPDNCYQKGNDVGVKFLHIAAREGSASSSCVAAYQKGLAMGADVAAGKGEDFDYVQSLSGKDAECYHTGFSDFAFLK